MSKTEELNTLIEVFAARYKADYHGTCPLKHTSIDSSNDEHLYDGKEMYVISMDNVAKHVYQRARKPGARENELIKSVDACIVTDADEWVLIEFRNQKEKSAKRDCLQKTYENWYMIMDILHEMQEEVRYSAYEYNDPFGFARRHVTFLLVCSSVKNVNKVKRSINEKRSKQPTTVDEVLGRIEGYLFKRASCIYDNELEGVLKCFATESIH